MKSYHKKQLYVWLNQISFCLIWLFWLDFVIMDLFNRSPKASWWIAIIMLSLFNFLNKKYNLSKKAKKILECWYTAIILIIFSAYLTIKKLWNDQ